MSGSIDETIQDFTEDITFLRYLLQDRFQVLESTKKHIQTVDPTLGYQIESILHQLHSIEEDIVTIEHKIQNASTDEDLLQIHASWIQQYRVMRAWYSQIAALALADEWQSPSFAGVPDQAGITHGRITASVNDYKRDQHVDGLRYEQYFKQEYIQHRHFKQVSVFATSTGMSALTTITGFLIGESFTNSGPIFVGKHSYFENKIVLKKLFQQQYVEFDEFDIKAIHQLAQESHPSVWFFDSLCNDQSLGLPNILSILKTITAIQKNKTTFVIDNTLRSITFQPFTAPFPQINNIILWESLLKHHQFGLDRVGGGIIVASCHRQEELYRYRDHLGTNCSDLQIVSLPKPNKNLLLKRLQRHQRNHQYFYTHIKTLLTEHPYSIVTDISSPSQYIHPDTTDYVGCICTLTFARHTQNVMSYKKFLHDLLKTAKTSHIPLVGGTSFGLPISRVYIPASRPGQGIPFFRVSIGMEPAFAMKRLIELFENVITSYY